VDESCPKATPATGKSTTSTSFLDALEEDALIDAIGGGEDIPETLDSERAVADWLGRFRTWGMQDPITTPSWEEHADKPLPPRQHTTGGTMSATDDANQLRGIQLPFGAIQQAQADLDNALAQASQILGASGTGLAAVQGAIQQAKLELDGSYSHVQEVENQLEQAAAGLTQG
jgi:hypothetical protein